jgi:integrase
MTVRKLKKSWWVDIRHNDIRYRKKSPDNSRAGAQAYEAVLRRKLAQGVPIDERNNAKSRQFKDFAWGWFDTYVKTNNKMSEIRGKKCILKTHLVPFIGKTHIDKVSNLQIEKYKARKISEGLTNKTINNHLTVLGKCLRTAQEWLDIEKLPRIKKLKVSPRQIHYLRHEEADKLLNSADGIWHDMIFMALKTGLRLGELRGLKWEDFDWQSRILTVRRSVYRFHIVSPKSNRERTIPLIDEIFDLFYPQRRKSGFVFSIRAGEPMRNTNCRYRLYEVCNKAGLNRIGWHLLRHTFASHLVQAGASIKAVQELLGHTDIKTTMCYAHLSPSTLKDTVRLISGSNAYQNFGQPVGNRQQKFSEIMKIITSPNPAISPKIKQKQDPKILLK